MLLADNQVNLTSAKICSLCSKMRSDLPTCKIQVPEQRQSYQNVYVIDICKPFKNNIFWFLLFLTSSV